MSTIVREKVAASSGDVLAEQIAKLKQLFPEVVSEGKIDWDRLRATLGDDAATGPERFSFTWSGKSAAIQLLQTPSQATLIPCPEESVDFDTTGNVFIEGDNLEVLKLLFKPYFGKVKLIYIDPPYNTGQDFVYPDNYADPLASYLQLTGQMDAEGNLLTSNPETSGRYHSAWLSMMYPRLFLARQLLRDDGVIFVSIGDEELANLQLILNEIFGEENRVGVFTWVKKRKGSHLSRTIRSMSEFVVAYARDKTLVELYGEAAYTDKWQYLLNRPNPVGQRSFPAGTIECNLPEKYYEPGRYGEGDLAVNLLDQVEVREGRIVNAFRLEGRFKWSQRKIEEELALGTRFAIKSIGFGPNMLRHDQAEKIKRPTTILDEECGVGTYEDANQEIQALFGEADLMDYPKPTSLIKYLVRSGTFWDQEGIVLDFFAGSATTAQAVLEMNREDGGSRRFILVQLPEPTKNSKFSTIAKFAKERIHRAIQRLKTETNNRLDFSDGRNNDDLGFKVFKLVAPHIRSWKLEHARDADAYAEKLSLFNDPLIPGWKAENVLWEITLREGYGLNSRFEKKVIPNSNTIFEVLDPETGQLFAICLDEQIRADLSKNYELTPSRLFVCRDVALDDSAAANLALQCHLKTI